MRILFIFGTRPEAIKLCPLILELKKKSWADVKVCVTGQHKEMLYEILDEFRIVPDWDLDVMKHGQKLTELCSKIQSNVDAIIKLYNPDAAIVHGDTSTTLNAALASFYNKIPIIHVEAGLRSKNKYSPFPEEINRVLTDKISDICFAPTDINKKNLLNEGIDEKIIYVVGNTISDAVSSTIKEEYIFRDDVLNSLDNKKKLILFTCHRRENLGEPMDRIFEALKQISEREDVEIVFPVHRNPEIREKSKKYFEQCKNVKMTNFLSYSDMINLLKKSYLIVTDSGGIQEEAAILNKPVLVVREETERVEAENIGALKIIGRETENIVKEIRIRLETPDEIDTEKYEIRDIYGHNVCEKIAAVIKNKFAPDIRNNS